MTRRFQTGDRVRVKPEYRKPGRDYPDMAVRGYALGDVICRRVDWETVEGRHDAMFPAITLEMVQ